MEVKSCLRQCAISWCNQDKLAQARVAPHVFTDSCQDQRRHRPTLIVLGRGHECEQFRHSRRTNQINELDVTRVMTKSKK